ncbi:hypothetical protein Xmlh_05835 [Xanthomonas axonopodis pv. melhusii]|uniref:Uncharacterized protein n=1 Tax=Xanthomonas axonopodis pv. melhusii TaxID=487834 RepID=A0A1T1PAX6_9XANT|nr:hypothetical protein [Xanthomonas axonopodis]OOW72770.1 hypothetical protein Xmlh_05835 [Xanthomonas axonopodis pv. melhusii]
MTADAGEQFAAQGFTAQGTVGVESLNWVIVKRKPKEMWRQCGVPALGQIGWAAGSEIPGRVGGQANK